MNPVSDSSKEISQPANIKKDKSVDAATSSQISGEIFEKIQQGAFRDVEHEDHELISQIGKKIEESRLPFPLGSPFADTDMIVFKDDYRGTLPRNGITESGLKAITQIYNDILEGKSKIIMDSRDDDFKAEMYLSIKTLLTREIGRKLIKQVLSLQHPTVLKWGVKSKITGNVITMDTQMMDKLIGLHPSGKLAGYPSATFLALGHELIHRIHPKGYEYSQQKPTLGKEYDHLEEQVTIVGLEKGLAPLTSSKGENVDNWEPIYPEGYYEINERNLTEAFTGALTEYHSQDELVRYPRVGHHGMRTSFDKQQLQDIIIENVVVDLKNLIKDKILTKEVLNGMFREGAMHELAIDNGRVEILELLLELDPIPQFYDGNTLLLIAANYANKLSNAQLLPMLEAILKTGVDINHVDQYGRTARQFLSIMDNKEAVQLIDKYSRKT